MLDSNRENFMTKSSKELTAMMVHLHKDLNYTAKEIAQALECDIRQVRFAIDPVFRENVQEAQRKAAEASRKEAIEKRKKIYGAAFRNSVEIVKAAPKVINDQQGRHIVPLQKRTKQDRENFSMFDIRRYDKRDKFSNFIFQG